MREAINDGPTEKVFARYIMVVWVYTTDQLPCKIVVQLTFTI